MLQGNSPVKVTPDSVVRASKDQVWGEIEGEAAILNLKNSTYYGLDPIGARIWNLLTTPRSVADIRDILLEEYEVDSQRCERDLLALLADLARHGLIEVSGSTAT